jgi:hypothetical protein
MFVAYLFLFLLKDKPFLFFLTLALIEPINDTVPCAVLFYLLIIMGAIPSCNIGCFVLCDLEYYEFPIVSLLC